MNYNNENNIDFKRDFVCISFRQKEDIFHRKYVNKILIYNHLNDFIEDEKRKKNTFFFTAGEDSIIKLWEDSHSPVLIKLLNNLEHHTCSIIDLVLGKENKILYSAGKDKLVCIWNLNDIIQFHNKKKDFEKTIFPIKVISFYDNEDITCLKYNENKDILYLSFLDGKIFSIKKNEENNGYTIKQIFPIQENDANNNKLIDENESIKSIHKENFEINSIDISQDGDKLIFSFGNEIKILDLNSNNIVCSFKGNEKIIKIKLDLNQKKVVSLSLNNTIEIWDCEEKKILKTINNFSDEIKEINCFYIYKSFNEILLGTSNGMIINKDLDDETKSYILDKSEDHIIDINMNKEEDQIIVSLKNGMIKFYNLRFKEIQIMNETPQIIGMIERKKELYSKEEENTTESNEDKIWKYNCNLVKNEIKEFKLMNNKIYCLLKTNENTENSENKNTENSENNNTEKSENDNKTESIINLLRLNIIKVDETIKFEKLCEKLEYIDKKKFEDWNSLNNNTGILNMILYDDCFKNNIINLDFDFVEYLVEHNFCINSSTNIFRSEGNENITEQEKSFGYFILMNIENEILYHKLRYFFENPENTLKILFKYDFKNDLFFNVNIKGENYSFYSKDKRKKILPDFCTNLFHDPYKKLFNLDDLSDENYFKIKNKFKIKVDLLNIQMFLDETIKNNENKMEKQFELKSGHTFRQLLSIIFNNLFNKKSIENKIQKLKEQSQLKEYQITKIFEENLIKDEYIYKFFYLEITKNNLILNKKKYYDFKISHILKLLNLNENEYNFKIHLNDFDSVYEIFKSK